MEFDFASDDHPGLITGILAACVSRRDGARLTAEEAWNLTVSQRIEFLLRLASGPRERVAGLALRCPSERCGQILEIDLSLKDLRAVQRSAERREYLECRGAGSLLRFRRPTGKDQRRWRAEGFADDARAGETILRSLALEEEAGGRAAGSAEATTSNRQKPAPECWGSELAAALDAQLEEFDPLVSFSVRAVCPQCGGDTDFPVDLEAVALRELQRVQRRILQEIHLIALHYHWSEADIFGLGLSRRALYLRLLGGEEVG